VLETHDASRFAIHAYSYGPEILDGQRERVRNACGVFRDIRVLKDSAAAERIAADEIDILVDLVGYTQDCRPLICARRPAPVLVNWLGYPGTLGHPRLADYIIGDPVVTPLAHAAHFSETLALMPNCYLPYDRGRSVGPRPSRQEAGLPEGKFVFCSFHQGYKLNPQVFDIWCRLLREVPQSVLWLQKSGDEMIGNLRREAQARGVDPERLVFAARVDSTADYLGRLQLADLALDTHPYTSHSTGSDLLWAGVPLVTKIGETFVSRVAASLLRAAGMPELITEDWEGYFALAKRLALEPGTLSGLRSRLQAAHATAPLFDTERFTRDLEDLYLAIWQHRQNETSGPVVLTPGRAGKRE
jgi:predicted O-linked N-acetylglucosamine transferase (SPINDLY family)